MKLTYEDYVLIGALTAAILSELTLFWIFLQASYK